MQVEPAAHERGGIARIEMAQRGLQQIEQWGLRRALHREAVGELGAVPPRGDAPEILAERRIDRLRLRAGEHVQLAAARKLIGGVRERLRVPGHPARRATDPLRDDVDLAEVAREENEDAVGFAEVDRPEDDRFGAVRARRHRR